jgi:hypothetical protein
MPSYRPPEAEEGLGRPRVPQVGSLRESRYPAYVGGRVDASGNLVRPELDAAGLAADEPVRTTPRPSAPVQQPSLETPKPIGTRTSGALTGAALGYAGGAALAGTAAGAGLGTSLGVAGSAFGPIGAVAGFALGSILGDSCFITEAVMAANGGGEDAVELEALRWFRDNVMAQTPEGQLLVQRYYQIAPQIVQRINERPDGLQVYQQIYGMFIQPSVQAIMAGDFGTALQVYAEMMAAVTGLLKQDGSQAMSEGEVDEYDDFEQEATMVASRPGYAEEMVAGGPAEPSEDGLPGDGGLPSGRGLFNVFPRG